MARPGRPRGSSGHETQERILNLAQTMAMEGGYHAFSFRDLAAALEMKSASIHYHFPTKEALGTALVDRYADGFIEGLEGLPAAMAPVLCLRTFASRFYDVLGANRLCLCGALAGEAASLPPAVVESISRFFSRCETWLTPKFKAARDDGALNFSAPPPLQSRQFLSLLEGLTLVLLTTGKTDSFDMVVDTYLADLAG